ncbi:MAG TPA: hypothetical protein V6C65_41255 [Allocoleopsis sp.]
MSDDSALTVSTSRTSKLGDRIRDIASQLRQEDEVQIKATSRILGAAAQLAENHDRLIDEVVEMVVEDLDRQAQQPAPYTVEQLQQQFKKLGDAKAHFGIKASGWANLVSKLNEQATPSPPAATSPQPTPTQDAVFQRLEAIEQEMQMLRGDINRAMALLELIVEKVS